MSVGLGFSAGGEGWREPEPLPAIAADLLRELYSQEDPVVGVGEPEAAAEHLLFAIWAQQWPKLRCDFRFATIATTRKVGGRPFDLRLFPTFSDSVLMRAFNGAAITESGKEPAEPEPWVAIALSDISTPGKFRETLRRYAADSADRTTLAPLAAIYSAIEAPRTASNPRADELLDRLAATFPEAGQMRRLKDDLLGPCPSGEVDEPGRLSWPGTEKELLSCLVTSSHSRLGSAEELDITHRARGLWRTDRLAAFGLLGMAARNPGNPYAKAALDGLLPYAVEVPDQLAKEAPVAVPLAISFDPEFAANAAIWTGEGPELNERWGALDSGRIAAGLRRKIVKTILAADTPSVIEPAFSHWGDSLVGDVLDIAGQSDDLRLSPGWVDLLRENSEAVSKWFAKHKGKPSRDQLLLVAEAGDPRFVAASRRSVVPWLELFSPQSGRSRFALSARQLAFLFCLGISSSDPAAESLLVASFSPLRHTLKMHTSAPAHQLIGREISTHDWGGPNPKKGQRLLEPTSQALARKWRDEHWHLANLIYRIDDPEPAAEILWDLLDSKRGRRIVKDFLKSDPVPRPEIVELLPSDWEKLAKK